MNNICYPTKHLCILVPALLWPLSCTKFGSGADYAIIGAIWDKFVLYDLYLVQIKHHYLRKLMLDCTF